MALETSAEQPVPVRTVLQLVGGWIGRLGRVWVYDPFGRSESAGFTPLVAAGEWSDALRTSEALAGAAHGDQENAASKWWDQEAATLVAPAGRLALLIGASKEDQARATLSPFAWSESLSLPDSRNRILLIGTGPKP